MVNIYWFTALIEIKGNIINQVLDFLSFIVHLCLECPILYSVSIPIEFLFYTSQKK